MAKIDRRRVMSAAEFDAIPVDEDNPIDGYFDALVVQNESLRDVLRPERAQELTCGQRMLIELVTFDGEVKNGGLTQYFWNRTESIFDVADWLGELGLAELAASYCRALEALVGNKYRWFALREEWAKGGPNDPQFTAFQQSYELLHLGWFDDAYYDQYGHDERQRWVEKSKGLHHALQVRLAEYVHTHRAEFITEA